MVIRAHQPALTRIRRGHTLKGNRKLGSVLWLGTSITVQGGFETAAISDPTTVKWMTYNKDGGGTWLAANGWNSGGTLQVTGQGFNGNGTIPTAFALAERRGVLAARVADGLLNYNYARGSLLSVNMDAIHATAISEGADPELTIVNIGTNDSASAVTVITTALDAALARLVRGRMMVTELLPIDADPVFDNPTKKAWIVEANTAISAWCGQNHVPLVAAWSSFTSGGDAIDALFKTNEVHPNEAGSQLLGQLIGAML